MIVTTDLLKVKTLDKRLAKQIQYMEVLGPLWTETLEGLRAGTIKPLGWVAGETLEKGSHGAVSFWLIHLGNRYWWVLCPTGGPLREMYPPKDIDQLFI